MSQTLTKTLLDRAKSQDREYYLWDTSLPGFGVRISPTGRKYFVVRKRLGPGQSQIKKSIGEYKEPMTLAVARQRAKAVLSEIMIGVDPRTPKISNSLTLNEFASIFLEQTRMRKKPASHDYHATMLNRHVLPCIGKKRVSQLSSAHITGMLQSVASGKTALVEKTKPRGKAIVEGGPIVANRALAVLSVVLTHAIDLGMRSDNPAKGIKKFREQSRERFLTVGEIKKLSSAFSEAEQAGTNLFAIAALKLILYTGARKSEILTLKWEYLDFERRLAFLPDSKTGAKPLYLPQRAIDLLSSLPRREATPWVFPSLRSEGPLVGLQKVWAKIRKSAGLDDVRIHDLRHTFASIGAARGVGLPILGKALGHSKASTTQRYAHLADDPVSQAVDEIAEQIGEL